MHFQNDRQEIPPSVHRASPARRHNPTRIHLYDISVRPVGHESPVFVRIQRQQLDPVSPQPAVQRAASQTSSLATHSPQGSARGHSLISPSLSPSTARAPQVGSSRSLLDGEWLRDGRRLSPKVPVAVTSTTAVIGSPMRPDEWTHLSESKPLRKEVRQAHLSPAQLQPLVVGEGHEQQVNSLAAPVDTASISRRQAVGRSPQSNEALNSTFFLLSVQHLVDLELRHRKAIVDKQISEFHEKSLTCKVLLNEATREQHAYEAKKERVLHQLVAHEPFSERRDIVGLSSGRLEEGIHSPHSATPSRRDLYKSTLDLQTESSAYGCFVGNAPLAESPRFVAVVDEEGYARSLVDDTSRREWQYLRKLLLLSTQALFPQTLLVQEQFQLRCIVSLFESEHINAMDAFRKWQWQQHVEHMERCARELAELHVTVSEARATVSEEEQLERDNIAVSYGEERAVVQRVLDEILAAAEKRRARILFALSSAEDRERLAIVTSQHEDWNRLMYAEDESFDFWMYAWRNVFMPIFSMESTNREEITTIERHSRRSLYELAHQSHTLTAVANISQERSVSVAELSGQLLDLAISEPLPTEVRLARQNSSIGSETSAAPEYIRIVDEPPKYVDTDEGTPKRVRGGSSARRLHRDGSIQLSDPAQAPPAASSSSFSGSISHSPLIASSASVEVVPPAASTAGGPSRFDEVRVTAESKRQAISEAQLRANFDRLSKPKRSVVHVDEEPGDAIELTTHSMNLDSRTTLRSGAAAQQPSSVHRQTDRYTTTPVRSGFTPLRSVPTGNSVMILRGSSPPRSTNRKQTAQQSKPVAAVVPSRRRYVDTFYRGSEGNLSGSSSVGIHEVSGSGASAVASPAAHARSVAASRNGTTPRLSRWEEETLRMYDKGTTRR